MIEIYAGIGIVLGVQTLFAMFGCLLIKKLKRD
jgi:hypothetical protein